MNIKDLAITSLETITCFDLVTGAFKFQLDELRSASLAQGQETVDITGKQGRKITTLKRNKTLTVSGENGLVSGGLLAAQVGGTFKKEATKVQWIDYLTVNSNKATTTYTAVGTTGAEIKALYIRNGDGTTDDALEQAAQTASGKFAYKTKELTFTGIPDGTEIVVIYDRKIQASSVTNLADHYSDKVQMYIDAMAEDKCGNVYRVQFYIPKADFSGEFTIELGGDQAAHSFEATGLTGGCKLGATGDALWTFSVFGANEADAT